MAVKHDTHKNIELRRVIASSAFTMIMLVAVIGLFSLFSIWSINRAWLAGTAETAELQNLSRDALDAQVSFKVQVQEWKNILLRGDEPALLEKYQASFRQNGIQTEDNLERVSTQAHVLGLTSQSDTARSLRQLHETVTARYEAALAETRNGAAILSPEDAHRLDKSLRGIDRELESSIGVLATDIAALSEQHRAGLAAKMQQRYHTLRWFITGVMLLSLVSTAYVVSGAIRATRG